MDKQLLEGLQALIAPRAQGGKEQRAIEEGWAEHAGLVRAVIVAAHAKADEHEAAASEAKVAEVGAQHAEERCREAEARRVAAEEQLRAETIRLEHGESTPFEVLQRERDLVDAESQKINALRLYRLSQAKLQRDEGTILSDRNVAIDQVRQLD